MNEYEREPIPGLPEIPPAGERILWQGAPDWGSLARHGFHARKVAVYFALILAWLLGSRLWAGESLAQAMVLGAWLLVLALLAIGLLLLLAWANGRATLYTLTNRRVAIRFGVAVSMTINIPYRQILAADLRRYGDGTGDIPLSLAGRPRVSYLVLWPFVRPWHFGKVQPMLRSVRDAERVAGILAAALRAASDGSAEAPAKFVEPGAAGAAPDLSGVASG
ncbi:MAG: photosynthetic complex putative assembly protein PuhB [Chromatiaceae bacterium]|nr:photosynthetic complex putative assembly protein PuhB [Candidatus Thioaporhodococcus sediminis]